MNSPSNCLPQERHGIIMISSTRRIGESMEQSAPSRRILAHHISYGALERTPAVRHHSKRSYWHQREYSAFRRRDTLDSSISKDAFYVQRFSERFRIFRKNHPAIPHLLERRWQILLVLALCLAMSCYHSRRDDHSYAEPEWKWDRNDTYDVINSPSCVSLRISIVTFRDFP